MASYPNQISKLLACFAFVVIVVGAFTRLTDAGLGCPDWPGCYGHALAPSNQKQVALLGQTYPEASVSITKAWTEMVHRYLAGLLGIGILMVAVMVIVTQKRVLLPLLLISLLFGQALLGMWTVTWKLHPFVVMAHLLGGITLMGMLVVLAFKRENLSHHMGLSLAVLLVFLQIMLGGWVSSNYAALSCVGFPTCNGLWWPIDSWLDAFAFPSIGANYEGGFLPATSRMTIHFIHRIGAIIVTAWLLWQFYTTSRNPEIFWLRWGMLTLLAIQVALGIMNVMLLLPLSVAVMHNAVAVILLMTLVIMRIKVKAHE